MNKAYGITANNFEELIDKINNFAEDHKILATQFLDGRAFYCIVWYEENISQNKPIVQSSPTTAPKTGIITDKQLKVILKWSKTEDGLKFLKTKGITSEEDAIKLTSKQASKIIKEGYELGA